MYVLGLFWRIHLIDLYANLISFIGITLLSTYALALAYKNTKFILKHKVCIHILWKIISPYKVVTESCLLDM